MDGLAGMDVGREAEGSEITVGESATEVLFGAGTNQNHHAAPEAGAGELRADYPFDGTRQIDERVDFGSAARVGTGERGEAGVLPGVVIETLVGGGKIKVRVKVSGVTCYWFLVAGCWLVAGGWARFRVSCLVFRVWCFGFGAIHI